MPPFAALSDPTRVEIIEALAERDQTVGELVARFPISQPAVSRHLRVLREAGLVSADAVAQSRRYHLNPDALAAVAEWATQCCRTWEERLDALGAHLDAMKEHSGGV